MPPSQSQSPWGSATPPPVPPPQPKRSSAVITAVVVTAAATLVLCAAVLVFAWFVFTSRPAPFAVDVQAPAEVAAGEKATLEVRASNPTSERLKLGSIDVYDSLLDGFEVIDVEPRPDRRDHTVNLSSFYYARSLAPGDAFTMRLHLRARRAGVFTGDVDVCTPLEQFVTTSVSIVVR
ncbi:MAG TPA: hypothetical protein VEB43_18805 [Anaeromyxobacter sp.]|nr:hypothetical protein [Anaeromyxobacter sp.]